MKLLTLNGQSYNELCEGFRWQIPNRLNVARWICDRHALHTPNHIALYIESDRGLCQQVSFKQLYAYANRFANALQELGISKGDRVAIVLPQRLETAVAHIAAHKLGAISLPLAVLFGPEAIEFRLRDSGAKVAIIGAEHREILAALEAELPALNHVIECDPVDHSSFWDLCSKASDCFQTLDTAADDPATLIYTSGTTGPPKGALVAHRALLGNLTGFEASQNFFPQAKDVFYTPADWAWTGGLWDGLLPSLNYGRPVLGFTSKKFDPEHAFKLCEKYSVSNAFIPPTALKMMRQVPHCKQQYKLKFRAIMSAGEQVGEELIHWGRESFGLDINEMWGQTEFNYLVGNCSAAMRIKPGSMGKPYPGHRVDVISPTGTPLPPGETGELAAYRHGDPVMFLGYWNNPQATQSKFVEDWFTTGDMAYKDEEGYFWFVGRNDDVISSAGYRIGPGEIEDSLLKHPAVMQAAVIGVPDALRGMIVKAFIVLAPHYHANEMLAADIQASVKKRLSAHEYPRLLEFIDTLPMTTTDKVRRTALRQRETQDRQSAS